MYKGRYEQPKESNTEKCRTRTKRITKARTKKRQQRIFFGSGVAVLVLVVVGILLLIKSCSGSNIPQNLCGSWEFNQTTVYTFREDGTGSMTMPGNAYTFTFSVEKTTIIINYAMDTISDCEYTYTISDDILTLTDGKGTIGGTYTLKRSP